MTDFANAAADLVADLGRACEAIARQDAALAALAARVALLEAEASPTPTPLVTVPPWPSTAVLRGSAPLQHSDTSTAVRLRPRTIDTAASSDVHEIHLPLPTSLARYTWAVDLALDVGILDALTWKFGGMVGFDGDWTRWPGGNTSGNTTGTSNTMERLVGQNPRTGKGPGYGVYATFPAVVADVPSRGGSATVGGARAWVTNGGHTCHWEIDAPQPTANHTDHHERQVDTEAGTLRHLINGDEVLALTGLPWPGGMNRVYVSCMIGGTSPDALPRTPDRTGTLTYSGFQLTPTLTP